MTTATADIRRFVSAAYTAMMRGRWEVAAELFNRCHIECLVMASKPRQDVPPPGALAPALREIANAAQTPHRRRRRRRIGKGWRRRKRMDNTREALLLLEWMDQLGVELIIAKNGQWLARGIDFEAYEIKPLQALRSAKKKYEEAGS